MMIHEEESNDSQQIEISNIADWNKFSNPAPTVDNDPFKIGEDEIRKLRGLSPTFRRKLSREFSKRFQGQDGAGTQQNLLAQAITGYSSFDLVEPPYNLEYLSKAYEVSTFNYAAINAKVSNIVGLGYEFIETKTKKPIEAGTIQDVIKKTQDADQEGKTPEVVSAVQPESSDAPQEDIAESLLRRLIRSL